MFCMNRLLDDNIVVWGFVLVVIFNVLYYVIWGFGIFLVWYVKVIFLLNVICFFEGGFVIVGGIINWNKNRVKYR